MSWAFDLLGVPDDADIASVKRAYARLLRTTRPDEDAEAFQRLHAAYQQALMHARAREAASTSPAAAPVSRAEREVVVRAAKPVMEAATRQPIAEDAVCLPAPASMEIQQPVDPGELASRIIRQAVGSAEERTLARWLSAQPELWSIRIKQQTGQMLLQQLFRAPAPMAPAFLDTLLEFFDLHQVQSGVNPVALGHLRQRQLALWYVQPANHRTCARRLAIPTGQAPDGRVVQSCLQLLGRPWRWYRVPWPSIRRGRVLAMARLIHGLCGGRIDDLPASVDPRQALFWYRAAQYALPSWPRFMVGSSRALLLGLVLLLGIGAACAVAANGADGEAHWLAAIGMGATFAGVSFSVWLVYAAWTWLDHWQGLPESVPTRHPRWRRALVPVLCVASALADTLHAPLVATAIILPTLVLAWRRFAHRRPPGKVRPRRWLAAAATLPGLGFVLIVLAKLVAATVRPELIDRVPLIDLVVAGTLGLWLADLWRHRAYLRTGAVA